MARFDGTWEEVGTVDVDSGQVMLVDPCYLGDWKHGDYDPDQHEKGKPPQNSYDAACRASLSDAGMGEVDGVNAFCCETCYGDGTYKVYVQRDSEGSVRRLMVDFDPAEDADDKNYEG